MGDFLIENGVERPLTSEEQEEIDNRRAKAAATADADAKAALNAPIFGDLASIDAKSVRPLRAVMAAVASGNAADPADIARLSDLKAQADALRAQITP